MINFIITALDFATVLKDISENSFSSDIPEEFSFRRIFKRSENLLKNEADKMIYHFQNSYFDVIFKQ
jgi:hypothetical protein